MSIWDNVKSYMGIGDEEFDDEDMLKNEAVTDQEEPEQYKKKENKSYQNEKKGKTISYNPMSQMQVVLVKPDRFSDVPMIADHLVSHKSVVLNLEVCEREDSRRIVDFLSGVAYALGGNIRKVATGTYMIVPNGVDVMGELMLDDFTENNSYLG